MGELLPLDHPLVPDAGAQEHGTWKHEPWLEFRSGLVLFSNVLFGSRQEALTYAERARDRLRAGKEIDW